MIVLYEHHRETFTDPTLGDGWEWSQCQPGESDRPNQSATEGAKMTLLIRYLRAEPATCALDALALASWCAGMLCLLVVAWGMSE